MSQTTTMTINAEHLAGYTLSDEQKEEISDRYFLPRSLEESARLQNQHHWVKGGTNALVLAPIDTKRSGLRVLDSATADGYWLHDVKAEFAEGTEFFGFDNVPEDFPPLEPPLNVAKHNLINELPDEWKNSFDFVHQRFIVPLFPEDQVKTVLGNLAAALRPGGWVQLVELNFKKPVSTPIELCPGVQKLHEILSTVVPDPIVATKLPRTLSELGFVNVDYKPVATLAGASHPDPVIGERGRKNVLSIVRYFQSVANRESVNMTEKEWAALPTKIDEEMKNHSVALEIWYVWGQRAEA